MLVTLTFILYQNKHICNICRVHICKIPNEFLKCHTDVKDNYNKKKASSYVHGTISKIVRSQKNLEDTEKI